MATAPLVGKRVVVSGISSRPDLNGAQGLAASFDDDKNRYNVKLDADGSFIALKPDCLRLVPGQDQDRGGAGGGTAPQQVFEEILRQLGGRMPTLPKLPAGITPMHLGIGVMAAIYILPKFIRMSRLVPLVLACGGVVAASRNGGIREIPAKARAFLSGMTAQATRVTGQPVTEVQSLVLLVLVLAMLWRYFSGWGADDDVSGASTQYAAYTKGYDDGKFSRTFAPILDSSAAASPSRGWGFGSVMPLLMLAGMAYQLGVPAGGGSWSPTNVMANARNMGPMQMMMVMNMVSGLF